MNRTQTFETAATSDMTDSNIHKVNLNHTSSIEIVDPSGTSTKSPTSSSNSHAQLTRTVSIYKDKLNIEGDTLMKWFMFSIVFIGIAVAFHIPNLTTYQVTAVIMMSISLQWTLTIILQVYFSTNISAIRVVNKTLPGFGFITFPVQFTQITDKPMESISEFAGVRGSTIYLSTLLATVTGGTLLTNSIIQRKKEIEFSNNGELTNQQWLVISMSCLSAVGSVFVGYFEMNNHSLCHTIMHVIGVPLSLCGLVAYGIVLEWNGIYWAIATTGLIVFLGWVVGMYIWTFGRKYPGESKRVHFISCVILIVETLWLNLWMSGQIVVVWFLNNI